MDSHFRGSTVHIVRKHKFTVLRKISETTRDEILGLLECYMAGDIAICKGHLIFITAMVVCSCFDVCWSFGVAGVGWYPCSKLQPATRIPPQPSHTETPTHIETRTHDQCGDTRTIEKSQAPDDGCINVRNMLSVEEMK